MGTLLLFFLTFFTAFAESPYNREQCLNEARVLIIASTIGKGPMLYDTDDPVMKYSDSFCNCLETNKKAPVALEKIKEQCHQEAIPKFKAAFVEMPKTMLPKEYSRRGLISKCLPGRIKDHFKMLEQTTLSNLSPEEKLVVVSSTALATCECVQTASVDFAYKGFEEKREFTKEEDAQIVGVFKSMKDSKEVKDKRLNCLYEGAVLLPLTGITPYDNPQIYIQECSPVITKLFSEDTDPEVTKKYADLVCQCAHPKIKGNETRPTIAKICNEEAMKTLGDTLRASKKETYREYHRKDLESICQGKKELIIQKIESSNLKSLKTETRGRLAELAMDSYCNCTGSHEIENTFKGISDAKTLSPEEEKLLKRNHSEYEKSYQRHKNNETCVEESLVTARKELADEIRTKSK